MSRIYDYIIIGSGFGGSVSALRLAEKGYSVLVLEQGKRLSAEDFPKTNRNLFKYLWKPGLFMSGFQKLSFFKKASILSGVGVGGGSLVYANTLFYPPEKFFSSEPWAKFADWKSRLEDGYRKAGEMLGRTLYNRKNTEDRLLEKTAVDFGREHTFKQVNVGVYLGDPEVETDPYFGGEGPLRKGCRECSGCMVGCRENAKNTLDKNYLFFAEKKGAKILPETRAEKIVFRDALYHIHTRNSVSVFKKKRVLTSHNLILAAGALGTLEILLKQKFKHKTLVDLSPKLGENLRTNSETLCAVSGAKEKLNNGLAISSVFNPDPETHIEIVKYPDKSNAMKVFFGLAVPQKSGTIHRTFSLLIQIFRHPVHFFKILFDFRWSTNLVIFLVMQSYDNAMKMKWKRTIFGGKMSIENNGQNSVPAYIDIGQKVMEHFAKLAGGITQNILLEVFFNRPTTAHILGGCPMGRNKDNGLINEKMEVFNYPGMYIVDGSVLQTNPGVNPSFSIMALAEYVMEQIPEKQTVPTDSKFSEQ